MLSKANVDIGFSIKQFKHNAKAYLEILESEDYSIAELKQAIGSSRFDSIDYALLIACYSEVDAANKPLFNRDALLDALEKTDFFDAAICDGTCSRIIKHLGQLAMHSSQAQLGNYRAQWYLSILKPIDLKRQFLELTASKSKYR